ncbi:MAG TPA: lipoprotein-releasing ABC transporter permease subunit [Micropepsaceae bacterium]|jgi:lipoprotein-releasing system permease protein|nr:lipoprotein-releasing ABC transporter permease subunit [Micropepsaceae bacterium]
MARNYRPFSGFEWMVAARYLRAKRQESFISVISGFSLIGIALGVATLIIVMSVMNGFRAELLGRILGLNGHLIVQSITGSIPDYDALAGRIRMVPGVTNATPIIEGQVLVNTEGNSFGALVRGLESQDLKNLTAVSSTLSPGAMDGFDEGDSVILGARLAEKLGLVPGMMVTLVAPKGAVTPFGTTPRVKAYRVAGIFRIGMSEYDQTFIFMPLKEAQAFFDLGNAVQGIEVMVTQPDNVAAWRLPIARIMGPQVRLIDWQQMNSSLFGALTVERNVMFMILTLIILVAALNIISGLIMLVKDKGGDIAILRTMGATQGAVMRVFFIAGASIGTIGTLSGVLIGVVFCANIENIRQFLSRVTGTTLFDPTIYFLSQMPAKIDPYDVISVVGMALSLSFLATLYPSWRAARLDPVEALRYE